MIFSRRVQNNNKELYDFQLKYWTERTLRAGRTCIEILNWTNSQDRKKHTGPPSRTFRAHLLPMPDHGPRAWPRPLPHGGFCRARVLRIVRCFACTRWGWIGLLAWIAHCRADLHGRAGCACALGCYPAQKPAGGVQGSRRQASQPANFKILEQINEKGRKRKKKQKKEIEKKYHLWPQPTLRRRTRAVRKEKKMPNRHDGSSSASCAYRDDTER